jgi:hypothetical protein
MMILYLPYFRGPGTVNIRKKIPHVRMLLTIDGRVTAVLDVRMMSSNGSTLPPSGFSDRYDMAESILMRSNKGIADGRKITQVSHSDNVTSSVGYADRALEALWNLR